MTAVVALLPIDSVTAKVCVPLHECTSHVVHQLEPVSMCRLQDDSVGVLCQSAVGRASNVSASLNGHMNETAKNNADFNSTVSNLIDTPHKSSPKISTRRIEKADNATKNRDYMQLLNIRPVKRRMRKYSYVIDRSKVEDALEEAKRRLAISPLQMQMAYQQQHGSKLFRNQTIMQNLFFAKDFRMSDRETDKVRLDIEVLSVLNEKGAIHRANQPRRKRSTEMPGHTQRVIPNCIQKPKPKCWQEIESKYFRNDNGQCNNLKNPKAGAVMTAQARLLEPRYEDNVWQPLSTSYQGLPLPSPRLISTTLINTTPTEDQYHTTSLVLFGQFVAHDIVSSGTVRPGGLESCCMDIKFPPEKLHRDCFPIRIPWNDYLYGPIGMDCMNQFRSRPADSEDCLVRPVSPANQATHFLDGSIIYGSSSERAGELREREGGRIKMDENNFLTMKNGKFLTGESRSNVVPLLTFVHTVWAREHNRIADELERLNPSWSDLHLYLMAKRILVGELQHIVYNEYLPIVLGQEYMDKHGISVDVDHKIGYSEDIDPSITVEFSTAAFRFGHSQVHDVFEMRSDDGNLEDKLFTAAIFFNEDLLKEKGMFERLARSLIYQKPGNVGSSYSSALHERLFASNIDNKGLDLVSLNINRGRDHGLPSYTRMLQACTGQPLINNWLQLLDLFHPTQLFQLMKVYRDVHDIELYVGGTLEKKVPGAIVGPVFQCIIGEQFFSLFHGDRFFYLNTNMTSSFSEDQLEEIKHSSWARIMCDNVQQLRQVQPLAMWQPHPVHNPRQSCDSSAIPRVNLTTFKE